MHLPNRKAFVAALVSLATMFFSVGTAFASTGAIFTTASSCDGTNINIFSDKSDVFLDGGPHHIGSAGLEPGDYYVQVTTPGGTVLGSSGTNKTAHVDANGAMTCLQLNQLVNSASSGFTTPGYDDTTNGGGEYKVWVSQDQSFSGGTNKTDNFKVKPSGGPNPQNFGSISGSKFNDLNADGIWQGGEPGISGWVIDITGPNSFSAQATTDLNGDYSFDNLAPGTYQVCEEPQSSWFASYPTTNTAQNCNTNVVVGDSQVVLGVNFGNYQNATISGHKYQDMNGDGSVSDDPVIANWGITLGGADNQTASTDGNGAYSFSVKPGTYTICEENRSGWIETFPAGTYTGSYDCGGGMNGYQVTVGSGDTQSLDFGNFQLGVISGIKFNDMTGNGVKDSGDVGLQNWMIDLGNGVSTTTTSTDSNGNYSFSGLVAGTYTVCEQMQSGWVQTKPGAPLSPACYQIIVQSGTNSIDDFGNFKTITISGFKWNDKNHNGVWDKPLEPGLANWTIGYSVNGSATTTTTTASDGSYSFSNLGPGNYMICEKQQAPWFQTAPTSGCYSLSAQSGTDVNNENFGNALPYWCSPGYWGSAAKYNIYTYINVHKVVNPPALVSAATLYSSINLYAPFLHPATPKKNASTVTLSQVLASPNTYGGPAYNSVADYFAYLLGWGGTQMSGENCPIDAYGHWIY